LGITYSTPKLTLGLSATHLYSIYLNEKDHDKYLFNLPTNIFGFLEYAIDLNNEVRWTPRFQISGLFPDDTLKSKMDRIDWFYEFGLVGEVKNKFWGGLTYRPDKTFATHIGILMLGINLGPNLRVGYAVDYQFGTFRSVGRYANLKGMVFTHEIMINYRIKPTESDSQNFDFTPRFFD